MTAPIGPDYERLCESARMRNLRVELLTYPDGFLVLRVTRPGGVVVTAQATTLSGLELAAGYALGDIQRRPARRAS
jgi:hypothetical protein